MHARLLRVAGHVDGGGQPRSQGVGPQFPRVRQLLCRRRVPLATPHCPAVEERCQVDAGHLLSHHLYRFSLLLPNATLSLSQDVWSHRTQEGVFSASLQCNDERTMR